jgi:hypothetical protein
MKKMTSHELILSRRITQKLRKLQEVVLTFGQQTPHRVATDLILGAERLGAEGLMF